MAMSFVRKFHQSIARLINHESRLLKRFCSTRQGREETSATSFTNRTHLCGDLRTQDVGKSVLLCGWLQYHRLSGTFMILRDWKGLVQLILPQDQVEAFKNLPLETVVQVKGEVKYRPSGQENKAMATGDVEVAVDDIQVLNTCTPTLPFEVKNFYEVGEPLRIKHRYLDLRLAGVQSNLRVRSKFIMAVRDFLINQNEFVEVETPTLFRRTPGGAREFIVPTHHPGKFYCLPQSPQQFKQLLMVGGLDRYFQVAKCYRDEGARADRQPEFTQLDLEMSFVTKEEVMSLVERILEEAWPSDKGRVQGPFLRMSYQEAMTSYGVDKPDLRFDWQLEDVTEIIANNSTIPPVFQPILAGQPGASVQALRIPGAANHLSKKEMEAIVQKGTERLPSNTKLVWCRVRPGGDWGPGLGRHLDTSSKQALARVWGGLEEADLVLFCCGTDYQPHTALGQVRLLFADRLESKGLSVRRDELAFLWVDDFPLFLPKEDGEEGLESAHHPFTAPHPEDAHLIQAHPEQVRGLHYDLVLNGAEIGGGSVRIHESALQEYVISDVLKTCIKNTKPKPFQEDSRELAHLLEALDSGCPPHGGIALGVDRLISIMCGTSSIRDVIAFPKISDGKDPLSNAPATVAQSELEHYHIQTTEMRGDQG